MIKSVPAIVIPLYKQGLTRYERISLEQCFKVLNQHQIIAAKPQSLSLESYDFKFDEVISFDDEYFADVPGYNKLMMSTIFYEKFMNYSHILIYQPDVFVFKDELLYWCNSGYDYIGAPWLRYAPYPDFVKRLKTEMIQAWHIRFDVKDPETNFPTELQRENKVGNGGFSLRNTKKFHEICTTDTKMIDLYNSKPEHYFGEDIFWSMEVNRKKKRLHIPDYKTAINFSIENNPEYAFQLLKDKFPFGCHAWDRNLDFWAPVLTSFGITL